LKTFKNSTALVLALSMSIPQHGIAQQEALDLNDVPDDIREQVEACIAETGDEGQCYTDLLTSQFEALQNGDPEQAAEAEAEEQTEPTQAAEVEAEANADVRAENEAESTASVEAETQTEVAPETAENAPEAAAEADAQGVAEANASTAEAEADPAPKAAQAEADAQKAAKAEKKAKKKNKLTKEERQARRAQKQAEAEAALEQSLATEEEGGASTAAALADADNADMDAEATEETITQVTARSSDEDFNTRVSQDANNDDDEADEEGMTNFEKAALAGLAALAVGSILKNGSQVASNSGDRVVLEQPDGSYRVIKDDGALLRQPGTTVRTQTYDDGSSRTISTREDGTQIITIYDSQKRIVRRERVEPNGDRYVLVDDSRETAPVEVTELPEADVNDSITTDDQDALRAALAQQAQTDRSFSLSQIRQISQVRALAPSVAVENVTFASGSAAIRPEQAEALSELGTAIRDRIAENPREIFLVEGHTDAVGNGAFNLALSDRRAESLALALTEYFEVPPENLVVQGYGEEYLKVETLEAEERNRRATVRRITDLLRTAQAD
jgi:outer membrane protein OmpA-like peptidoglycan-associated protein